MTLWNASATIYQPKPRLSLYGAALLAYRTYDFHVPPMGVVNDAEEEYSETNITSVYERSASRRANHSQVQWQGAASCPWRFGTLLMAQMPCAQVVSSALTRGVTVTVEPLI